MRASVHGLHCRAVVCRRSSAVAGFESQRERGGTVDVDGTTRELHAAGRGQKSDGFRMSVVFQWPRNGLTSLQREISWVATTSRTLKFQWPRNGLTSLQHRQELLPLKGAEPVSMAAERPHISATQEGTWAIVYGTLFQWPRNGLTSLQRKGHRGHQAEGFEFQWPRNGLTSLQREERVSDLRLINPVSMAAERPHISATTFKCRRE